MIGLAGKIIRRLAAEGRELRRWEALRRADNIRVYYGMDRLPDRDEPMSGGIVKCLDLAQRFPNAADKANLLYLVSSALPDRRDLLARAARRASGRFVLNQNGVAYPAWAGAAWPERNAPNARMHERADFVVYQSDFCRRCAEKFLSARKGPGEVLHNPVDTSAFSPREGFDRNNRAPVLLAAGSHYDAYRVRRAIEALALVRRRGTEPRLVVAGRLMWDAEAETEARRWARDAGMADAVEFSGRYSQAQAPALFRRADVLVHLQVQDSCPRTVVEAMACGVPVVYSATGGTPELVGDGAGAAIPGVEDFDAVRPPSVEAVADGILRVLSDREAFSKRARERAVGLFSVGDWLAAHARIFESLAKGGGK